ncbi:hypothetical protein [Rhizobium sp. SSA_523]|nr:hypothetical protein [Rhizobium sp. SSA_523]MCO5733107.1 hypothetical protein [Rhizobium sp. SSA_523]WKC23984.1 hypothetical protein QTJ18_24995 [Rhizobium sp. SSA_523]
MTANRYTLRTTERSAVLCLYDIVMPRAAATSSVALVLFMMVAGWLW